MLFYIAYMREIPDPFSGNAHPCKGGSCLAELQLQLLVVFTTKTMGKQVGNSVKPFVASALATFKANKAIALAIKNAQLGLKSVPAMSKVAEFVPRASTLLSGKSATEMNDKNEQRITSKIELQSKQVVYEGTFDDFNDRAIQFGYLVLFAPAYPLAPFLALINNIIEIRSAAYRQCRGFQRTTWKSRQGIGSWLEVLNILGFLAVITNASMIAFVGSQEAMRFNLLHALSFTKRVQEWQLWTMFFLIEHSMMLLRILLLTVAPTTPGWVNTCRETLDYRIGNVFKTPEMKEMEKTSFRLATKYPNLNER